VPFGSVSRAQPPAAFWQRRYASVDLLWPREPSEAFADFASRLSPGRALDIGAGEGRHALLLADHGWDVTALDVSPIALSRLRGRARSRALDIPCITGSWRYDLPPAGEFDLVVLGFLHPRPDERDRLFRVVRRALRPGGYVFVIATDPLDLGRRGPPEPYWFYTVDALRDCLRDFDVERCEQVSGIERYAHRDVVAHDIVAVARRCEDTGPPPLQAAVQMRPQ
jgi:SAM-dependent methyltransferase